MTAKAPPGILNPGTGSSGCGSGLWLSTKAPCTPGPGTTEGSWFEPCCRSRTGNDHPGADRRRRGTGSPWVHHDPVSYTHLRAHETVLDLVCRLLLEKKKK